jgi:hypothetical protein
LPGLPSPSPACQNKDEARKGEAFERETLRFFTNQDLDAKSFKFKRDGEEFQYDVVVPWGDHIFILECKNRTLSGHNPVAAYYFALEIASAIKQVTRLASAMVEHPDAVLERTGIDVTNKTVVACVVNSLPYAMKGDKEGVYVVDVSALKRFFQECNFHIIRPHYIKGKATVLHRTAMKALWKGDKPTPADLMAYLADPLPLQVLIHHTKPHAFCFDLGERTIVAVTDLSHEEITTASIAKLFSVDEKWVAREEKAVTRAIRDGVKKHEQRSVRKADRAWRAQQRRK